MLPPSDETVATSRLPSRLRSATSRSSTSVMALKASRVAKFPVLLPG